MPRGRICGVFVAFVPVGDHDMPPGGDFNGVLGSESVSFRRPWPCDASFIRNSTNRLLKDCNVSRVTQNKACKTDFVHGRFLFCAAFFLLAALALGAL